jgi:hypothetical protein
MDIAPGLPDATRRMWPRLGLLRAAGAVVAVALVVGTSSCSGGGPAGERTTDRSTAVKKLKGDEDDDESPSTYTGNSTHDNNDADFDNDFVGPEPYPDSDDRRLSGYGRAASRGEARVIAAVARRFLEAAAAGDGVRACARMDSATARSVPEEYGRPPGPSYARGRTCATVASKIFRHDHERLAKPVAAMSIRVESDRGIVLLTSSARPASYLTVRRDRGAWRTTSVLDQALP